MDVTKPYKFIGFGAMGVTKPCKFTGFGVMDVTKPYEFIRFGAMDVIKQLIHRVLATSLKPVGRKRHQMGLGLVAEKPYRVHAAARA